MESPTSTARSWAATSNGSVDDGQRADQARRRRRAAQHRPLAGALQGAAGERGPAA